MEDSVTYQWLISQGEERGILKGEKKLLLVLGQSLFGPPDQEVLAALDAITDQNRLERLAHRLPKVTGWRELLAPE